MKQCRTLNSLVKSIGCRIPATLVVYSDRDDGVWGRSGDRVVLNLGNGRYPMCSDELYQRVKKHLTVNKI